MLAALTVSTARDQATGATGAFKPNVCARSPIPRASASRPIRTIAS